MRVHYFQRSSDSSCDTFAWNAVELSTQRVHTSQFVFEEHYLALLALLRNL